MTSRQPQVAAYLDRLAQELEGLDPAERDDFLRELATHIEDALQQMDAAVPEAERVARVLERLGAPRHVGRAYVYERLLWLGWQRQSARLVVKGLMLGASAILVYAGLLAVLVGTVWAGVQSIAFGMRLAGVRGGLVFNDRALSPSTGAGLLWLAATVAGLWLLLAERRLLAAVQRAVARWADRLPDRRRLPLPVPGEGLGWWLFHALQALIFGLAVVVIGALVIPMACWGWSIVAGAVVHVRAEPFLALSGNADGVSLDFGWAFWTLLPLAMAASMWWQWFRVKRSRTT